MPSAVTTQPAPTLNSWKRPKKTSHDLPWADIKVLDLKDFDAPGGKQKLAEDLRQAVSEPVPLCSVPCLTFATRQVHETGFFTLINTGFSSEEVQRQYDIGQEYFGLPKENKGDPKYRCDFTKGNYFGYRAVSLPPPHAQNQSLI
jgi:gibberellin 2-oxidase